METLREMLDRYRESAEPDFKLICAVEALLEDADDQEKYSQRIARRRKREQFLDVHVPDRVCEVCEIRKHKSKSWVILKDKQVARIASVFGAQIAVCCRSCYTILTGTSVRTLSDVRAMVREAECKSRVRGMRE